MTLRERLIALCAERECPPADLPLALAAARMALEDALTRCETGAQRWPVMRARIRALAASLDEDAT